MDRQLMNTDISKLCALKNYVEGANNIVAFTGAGISVPSGIPDFRSATGLYSTKFGMYSPEEVISHDFFFEHTKEFYEFYTSKMLYPDAKPCAMHSLLASLERIGKLSCVITQNIDGLHQKAGSKNVCELHGSVERNYCLHCGKSFDMGYVKRSHVCDKCGGTIKPDVVLYGETLNSHTIAKSISAIRNADLFIVIGTSLVVYPAAGLVDYFRGEHTALINKSQTTFDSVADVVINDDCNDVALWLYENLDIDLKD